MQGVDQIETETFREHRAQPVTTQLVIDFVRDEAGQDIVEYALLTAVIGLVGFVTWQAVTAGIGTAYQGWDTGTQDLWEPANPGGGS